MLQETSEDFEECEAIMRSILTEQEKAALTQRPIWSLGPPQRESYLFPATYARGMKDYAKRVIKHNKSLDAER